MGNPSPAEITIRDATEEDLPFMNEVYNYNILNSVGLFFTSPLTDEDRLRWFRNLKGRNIVGEPYPCLLGLRKGADGKETEFGYACYVPLMEGEEFQRVVQISLYIAQEYTGLGLGTELLTAILAHRSTKQLRGIVATITTENTASIKFFSKRGFVYSGQLNNVGYKFGRWLDVAKYTLYLPSIPDLMSVKLEYESSSTARVPHCDTPTITCRDIRLSDLPVVNDIHNEKKHYLSINSFVSATTMEERHAWYECLGTKPSLPCPAILAETMNEVVGYAYLKPISPDKPAYEFSVGIHLAARNRLASSQLLGRILSHPFSRRFRLITMAIAPEPFIQELLAQGFRQSITWNQLAQRNGTYEDILMYSVDLKVI